MHIQASLRYHERWTGNLAELASMIRTMVSSTNPMMAMTYPGFVFRALRSDGHDAKALLEGTRLTEERLSDPVFRSDFPPLRRLFLNAMARTGDPHLGVTLGRRFEPTYIGLPAYTAMNAATFGDALAVLRRFFFLAFPAIEFIVDADPADPPAGASTIRLRPMIPLDDINYFAATSALIACDGLLKAILRRERVVLRAEATGRRPVDWAKIAGTVEFPIDFEARDNTLVVPRTLLNMPLPATDPINHKRLLALCEAFAAETRAKPTPVRQVLEFLASDGNLKAPLSAAATALGYSERGLRRQLERAGTTYRTLVDDVHARRARALLTETALPVQTIAYDLGFDTPSNFARCFKRWTGASPTAFRERRDGEVGQD
jgi:AraC-like DNA-binding protein